MVMDQEWVSKVQSGIPELPAQRRARFAGHGLETATADVVSSSSPHLRRIYEDAVGAGAPARSAANWVMGELTAAARRSDTEDLALSGADLAELIFLVDGGKVSSSAAKEVLEGVLRGEGAPAQVAEERDLIQITDLSELGPAVDAVIEANPKAVADFRTGETKIIGYLVGQVMKATHGKADPQAVNELLVARLGN
jgi:aspartyl-tRNA(Asn)/glutamyl-tRNA(Gln) amidotransferase subunit B